MESEQQRTVRLSTAPRKVTRQQTQSVRGMPATTRSQSQTHIISLNYFNKIIRSLPFLIVSSP